MFTGIVQSMAVVRSIRSGGTHTRLTLEAPNLVRPISNGASISVSGVCLTVTKSDAVTIDFDIVPETLSRTTLGSLAAGHRLNLEASLRAGDPIDGHIVQGHIDGIAKVTAVSINGRGHTVTFE